MDTLPRQLGTVAASVDADCRPASLRGRAEELAVLESLTRPGFPGADRSLLIQIIEGEIIPRLFLAHREPVDPPQSAALQHPDDPAALDREHFAKLFLQGADDEIVQRLLALLDEGAERDTIYFQLLASVPRALCDLWEKGLCTIDAMTRGLKCLDQVLSEMHQRERSTAESL